MSELLKSLIKYYINLKAVCDELRVRNKKALVCNEILEYYDYIQTTE